MKTIGVTGGIGSGKSTAARILGELGAHVVDADLVGHETYRAGTRGWQQVVEAFGPEIVSPEGAIDRKRLGAIVFAHPAQLAKLNSIVHPLIRDAIRERIESKRREGWRGPIVVEAAVLIEANWVSLIDELWLVVADRETVVDRVRAQRGLDREAIEARLSAQLTDEARRRHATVVIDNSGSPEDLRRRIEELWLERLAAEADPD